MVENMPILTLDDKEVLIIESKKVEDTINQVKSILKERKDVDKIVITEVGGCFQ